MSIRRKGKDVSVRRKGNCLSTHRKGKGEDGEARKELTTPAICTRFLTVMADAAIPSHYTAYSVKHAVVTRLFRLGATEDQVNAYGGWAPGSKTAMRWYNIATLEEDWLGAKLVGECFGKDPDEVMEGFLESHALATTTDQEAADRAAELERIMRPPPKAEHDVCEAVLH
jgi:hypothetical protein